MTFYIRNRKCKKELGKNEMLTSSTQIEIDAIVNINTSETYTNLVLLQLDFDVRFLI